MADCGDRPGPGIDWTSCTKSNLLLGGEDLKNANLQRANLSGTDLREADLSGANMTETDLSRGRLAKVTLKGANFTKAMLNRADLQGADLSSAQLAKAELPRANLSNAILVGSNLEKAELGRAVLVHATGCAIWSPSSQPSRPKTCPLPVAMTSRRSRCRGGRQPVPFQVQAGDRQSRLTPRRGSDGPQLRRSDRSDFR